LLLCVGTPALPSGDADLSTLESACDAIGPALRRDAPRSSSCAAPCRPARRAASSRRVFDRVGLQAGREFHVAVQPEFLREGNALADFDAPPKLVVGALDPMAADASSRCTRPRRRAWSCARRPRAPSSPSTRQRVARHEGRHCQRVGAIARAVGRRDALMADFVRDRRST
jgi:hypothetical protein